MFSRVQIFVTLGLYSPCNSPGQNTGVGSHSLLQGIFLTQKSNQGLLHCRRILYQLSYQGSQAKLFVFRASVVVEEAKLTHFYLSCCYSVTKSCPTLGNPMDCSTPGSPVPQLSHGVCSNSCPLSLRWGGQKASQDRGSKLGGQMRAVAKMLPSGPPPQRQGFPSHFKTEKHLVLLHLSKTSSVFPRGEKSERL